MVQRAPTPRLSFAEYLAIEEKSPLKHEYADGEMYAMTGGTTEHARLAAAMIREVGIALRGKPCAPFSSDLRVRIEETNRALYPDVSIVCGKLERARDDAHAVTNPAVVIEVLSDSTEAYDLGDKFAQYRRLPSLREVVFVSQREPRLEVYARGDDNRWVLSEYRSGATAEITSVGVRISVDAVYLDPLTTLSPRSHGPQQAIEAGRRLSSWLTRSRLGKWRAGGRFRARRSS
jgi:Uma2 family endonuclease